MITKPNNHLNYSEEIEQLTMDLIEKLSSRKGVDERWYK